MAHQDQYPAKHRHNRGQCSFAASSASPRTLAGSPPRALGASIHVDGVLIGAAPGRPPAPRLFRGIASRSRARRHFRLHKCEYDEPLEQHRNSARDFHDQRNRHSWQLHSESARKRDGDKITAARRGIEHFAKGYATKAGVYKRPPYNLRIARMLAGPTPGFKSIAQSAKQLHAGTACVSASTAPTAASVSSRSSWSSESWTFARWLSWRQLSPSNVSHRLVSASREPPGPSSSGQGCF
jgi:hypothetical protein